MASPSLSIIAVAFCFVSLISPSISQICSSQNLNSETFESCLDLPAHDAYLHYTYDATNSSLSVAFVATPSRSDGWVAWAINPTATGMNGSQAFLAYRSSSAGAAPVVNSYNISGFRLIPGRLAFDFWNLRAETMRDGKIAIFTTVKVPAGADRVNQVWQIGGNVTNGVPGVHPFAPANLNSRGVLSFTADPPDSAPSPGNGGSNTPGQAGGPGNAGSFATNVNFGVNFGILVLLGSIFIF
ncbi:unnamed protein product [Cochlearia groenlandica]